MESASLVRRSMDRVYLKAVDDNNRTFSVPLCLAKMRGGVNAFDIAEAVIKTCLFTVLLHRVHSIRSMI